MRPYEPVDENVRRLLALLNQAQVAVRGNIDLAHRPQVKTPDGIATVRSQTFTLPDGRFILLPSVIGNRVVMDPHQVFAEYRRTGRHLGIFASNAQAERYANLLHREQAAYYLPAAR